MKHPHLTFKKSGRIYDIWKSNSYKAGKRLKKPLVVMRIEPTTKSIFPQKTFTTVKEAKKFIKLKK